MDDASCASELAKSVNILDAIYVVEKCMGCCESSDRVMFCKLWIFGHFSRHCLTELSSEMECLLDQLSASITLEEYASYDHELDTCQPLEKDWRIIYWQLWERKNPQLILEDETNMEAADPNNMPVVSKWLSKRPLWDFAFCIIKSRSQTIVEETLFKVPTKYVGGYIPNCPQKCSYNSLLAAYPLLSIFSVVGDMNDSVWYRFVGRASFRGGGALTPLDILLHLLLPLVKLVLTHA